MVAILTAAGYAGALALGLGAVEGALWGWLTQSPEGVFYRPAKCAVWAAATWTLVATVSLLPLAVAVAAALRSRGETTQRIAGQALGIAWPVLLIGGLTINRELLPSLLSPLSIAVNAALVVVVALAALLLARWRNRGTQARAAPPGWRSVLPVVLAAFVYGSMSYFEHREREAVSLTAYARSHCGQAVGLLDQPLAGAARPAAVLGDQGNVLIVLIDALRASNMGCYGYARDTTPNMDRLAQKSVIFDHAICQKTSTSPSCASLFTGVYPHTHGIVKWGEWLDDSFFTMAECLRSHGFATAEVANNSNVSEDYNFAQGFETAEQPSPYDPRRLTDAALARLSELCAQPKPWFAYIHYLDPHEPFEPPEPYDEMFVGDATYRQLAALRLPIVDSIHSYGHIREKMAIGDTSEERTSAAYYVAQYDAEVKYVDDQVVRVFARLQELEQWDHTLVIITADHGESLGEHGWWFEHGANAYQEVAHVPLMFHHPKLKPKRVSDCVESFSIMPTVLDLLGLPKPETLEAPTLADIVAGERATAVEHKYAFVEGRTAEPLCRAVVTDEWKLIWNWPPCSMREAWSLTMLLHPRQRPKLWHLAAGHLKTPVWELYNLREDPTEQRNVVDEHPSVAEELKHVLFSWVASAPRDERQWAQAHAKPIGEEAVERLRSLGYVR